MPEVDDIEATTDFLDIPMDSLKEINELNDYLSQAIEKVTNPVKWWWDHRKVFPKLSVMAFDFLSVPGMLYLIFLSFIFSLMMFISNINCRRASLFVRADICFISPGIACHLPQSELVFALATGVEET